ncbi:hypothetical protein [Actinacidiphila glaucinigra]|nr:hypothetical protein [Actinacidiphila glaucinigra]
MIGYTTRRDAILVAAGSMDGGTAALLRAVLDARLSYLVSRGT